MITSLSLPPLSLTGPSSWHHRSFLLTSSYFKSKPLFLLSSFLSALHRSFPSSNRHSFLSSFLPSVSLLVASLVGNRMKGKIANIFLIGLKITWKYYIQHLPLKIIYNLIFDQLRNLFEYVGDALLLLLLLLLFFIFTFTYTTLTSTPAIDSFYCIRSCYTRHCTTLSPPPIL